MINSSVPTPVKPSASDLELTLAQVQGIYATRITLDGKREPGEIHVLASTARAPKQLVRDIETIVYVKHGIRIDYRKISLVQLAEEDLLRLPVTRPEIRQIVEEDLGEQRRVRVEIQGGGHVVRGEACERADHPTTLQTAARATLSCIEQLVGHHMDVRLENATTLRLDVREIAIVVLTCMFQDREETFVGASLVGTRLADAAARATLDALNRRILLFPA